jgi:hypothetical protein
VGDLNKKEKKIHARECKIEDKIVQDLRFSQQ